MKEWILSIGVTIIITSAVSLILPDGQIGKTIKNIFSIMVLAIFIKPIFNFDISKINFNNLFYRDEIVLQKEYLEYTIKQKENIYIKKCISILENLGVSYANFNLEYEIADDVDLKITKVYINLQKAVINLDKEHIDIIDEIKSAVSKYLNIEESCVVIYE